MDQDQLLQVMLEEAKDFKKATELPKEDEVIKPYVSRKKGKVTGEQIFPLVIQGVLKATGHKEEAKKKWPLDWPTLTFRALAEKIMALLLILMFSLPVQSQFNLTLGTGVSSLKDGFIQLGLSYGQSRDSIWQRQNNLLIGKNAYTAFYPSFSYRAGSVDLPNLAELKMTGLTIAFKKRVISTVSRNGVREDIIAPDLSRTFHTFPFSVGIEMSGPGIEKLTEFNNINGIAEFGWVPWFQQVDALDNVSFGLFVQGGYKFYKGIDSAIGGEVDESLEKVRSGILRLKASLGGSVDTLIRKPIGMGVEADGFLWHDVLNGKLHKQLIGNLKFYIGPNATILAGFRWGSGMPLGNTAFEYQIGASFKL